MKFPYKNIAFTGGGTGGHIYPCLALIEELISTDNSTKVYYIGNSNKLEAELLTKSDLKDYRDVKFSEYINFLGIRAEPLIKSWNPIKVLKWFLDFFQQVNLCKQYLESNKIGVVFGTGGYVSGPVFAACKALKIPYLIHNLDAFIGIANSVFVKDAYALTLGLPNTQKISPKNGKVIITGNPISKKFLNAVQGGSGFGAQGSGQVPQSPEPSAQSITKNNYSSNFTLLITGGSQGAESINNAIGKILPELIKLNIQIIHVTGAKTYNEYINKFLESNIEKYSNYKVIGYTHEMPELCKQADLTVCRAGAMTIAEMSVSAVVPIFVPLPWAAHDHQNLNAQSLVEAGAAYSLNQTDKDFAEQLLNTISKLVSNPNELTEMREKLKAFAKPDAAKEILEIIQEAL